MNLGHGRSQVPQGGVVIYCFVQDLARQKTLVYPLVGMLLVAHQEVIYTVEGNTGLDAGIHILLAGLQLGPVFGQAHQGGQVTASGAAGDGDEFRVHTILATVFAYPAQGALAVLEVSREAHTGAEAVIGRHTDPAPAGQVVHKRQGLAALVPHDPGATVDLQQHRATLWRQVLGAVDIQLLAHTVGTVGHVADELHPGHWHGRGVLPVPPADLVAQPVADCWRNLVAVGLAQSCLQGLFHRGLGEGGLPDAPHQARPGRQQYQQRHYPQSGIQRPGPDHQPGEQNLQRQPDPGHFGGQQGGEENRPGHGSARHCSR